MSGYQVMPPLSTEEYDALKADVADHGVRVPVDVDEQGSILDGHHRAQIAGELGIDYPTRTVAGLTEEDKREHAFAVNLKRRQLGPISWADAFRRLAEVRGVELGKAGRKPGGKNSATVAELSTEVGVSARTARRHMQLANELTDHPDIAAKVDSGEIEGKRALRVARERRIAEQREYAATHMRREPTGPGPAIWHCAITDLADHLEPDSIDLVFTDPPYPAREMHVWSDLAAFAAKTLKPGALLVAYSGQLHFPEAMERLRAHLDYWWIFAVTHRGPHEVIHHRRVWCSWKPLLVFRKPGESLPAIACDLAPAAPRDKTKHEWQQAEQHAAYYIERLTVPGDHVVDPFIGSGTTAAAAHALGRRFTGCDVDPAAVATARQRIGATS